jgi:hypothetical protein
VASHRGDSYFLEVHGMRDLIGALIEISFAIAMVAAVVGVAEWIGVLRFSGWAYRLGPVVLRAQRRLPLPPAEIGHTFGTAKGQFQLVDSSVCRFHPRTRWLSVLDSFAVAGELRWGDGDSVEVEGRVPLSTIVFLWAWAVGWLAAGVYVGMTGGHQLAAWGIALCSPVTVAGAWYLLVPIEAARSNRVLDELEAGLAEIGLRAAE